MSTRRLLSGAGLAAIAGALIAIVLTPPFATAYFLAYPGYDVPPFWLPFLEPRLGPVLSFAPADEVYETYGRIYNLAYLLFLPAAFALHRLHRGSANRWEKRGFVVLVAGLLATFVGVAGDYWAHGIGFLLEVLGLLVLMIGSLVYGIALLRIGVAPRWVAWSFVLAGPGALLFMFLIGHIPSGPTFPLAICWLLVGFMLLSRSRATSTGGGTSG